MLSNEEIQGQQALLAATRRRLATRLEQYSIHGSANAPPEMVADIDVARADIKRIKEILRAQRFPVDDHPDDEATQSIPSASSHRYESARSGDVQSADNRQDGGITFGDHTTFGDNAQITTNVQNTTNINSHVRPSQKSVVVAVLIVALLLAGIGFLIVRPWLPVTITPMPEGAWNVAIADIGWDNGDGIARTDRRTANLSARIFPIIESRVESEHSRRVAPLTGDSAERARQAADIAARTNASVVVYGVLRPTTPGVGQFQPEFYVNPNMRNAAASVSEIVGTSQFGAPIEVTLNTTRSVDEDAIGRRMSALEFVLNGVNQYVAERYDPARREFESALKALELETDGRAAAVIYEFIAATELGANRYDQALSAAEQAHQRWSGYARAYLTRASIRYAQANALLPGEGQGISIRLPQAMPHCFDSSPNTTTDAGWSLAEALDCFDTSLQAPDQPSDIELANKVAYSKANIYVTMSFYGGGEYWDTARPLLEQVINAYQTAQTDDQRQRLRRIAAHAYARRGLLRYYAPGSTPESRMAAIGDYQAAIDLLETPYLNGESCHNKPDSCYKSDVPFIDVYTRQLQQLKSAALEK
jgi:tetratricopeptide (TPR) repeat protein